MLENFGTAVDSEAEAIGEALDRMAIAMDIPQEVLDNKLIGEEVLDNKLIGDDAEDHY